MKTRVYLLLLFPSVAQQIKVLVIMPEDLISISRTDVVEEENGHGVFAFPPN